MAIYLITYDLNKEAANYQRKWESVTAAIKSLNPGSWAHPLDSTWLVEHPGNAAAIYKYLVAVFDVNDRLLVCAIGTDIEAYLASNIIDWLKPRAGK